MSVRPLATYIPAISHTNEGNRGKTEDVAEDAEHKSQTKGLQQMNDCQSISHFSKEDRDEHLEREGNVCEEQRVPSEQEKAINDAIGSLRVGDALLNSNDVGDLTKTSPARRVSRK